MENARLSSPVQPDASESARRKKLGELAVERGLVNQSQLSDALHAQSEMQKLGLSERIGTILLKKKVLSKDTLQELLREQSGGMKRLGNFEIQEKIGQGAMGVVYKARQVSMDRTVALKILARKYATDPQFIERFVKEARAAGQFSHENIVTAVDVGFVEPYHYFAMEYVEGRTLRSLLAERGALGEAEATKYTLHIAKALEHALTKKIIHRDVKPENVIVTPHGTAKLLDMGLACAVGAEEEGSEEEEAEKAKQPRKAAGTPHYISPEAARGQEDLDTRADIYSLGCSYFQLLTNATPFEGTDGRTIMARHVAEDVPDPRTKKSDLSPAASRIVARMCARNRDDRYATPTELIEDLQAFLDGKPMPHAGGGVSGKTGKLRGAHTTGPRAPIGPKGTTGPRAPVQPRSTTGPASPVIVGDRTGALSPTGPADAGSKAAEAKKNNAVIWAVGGVAAALLLGLVLLGGGGSDNSKHTAKTSNTTTPAAEKTVPAQTQPESGPEDTHKVDVRSPGPNPRDERARLALESVVAQIKGQPQNFAAHQQALQKAVQQARGTPSADAAAEAWTALEKAWTEAMAAALKDPQAQADAALKAGNFAAASDAVKDDAVAPELRAFAWKQQLEEARKPVREAAEARGAKLLEEARAKAGEKSEPGYLTAIELAKQAQTLPAGFAPSAREAARELKKWEGELAALKKAEAKALAAQQAEGLAQAAAVRKELAPILAQGHFAQALELLDRKSHDTALPSARTELQNEKADIEAVVGLRKQTVDALNRTPGKAIEVIKGATTIKGSVGANDRGGLTLKLGDGPEIAFSAEQLDARDIDRFAGPANSGEDWHKRGLLYLAAGQLQAARDRFAQAQKSGLDAAGNYLKRLEIMELGEAEVAARQAWEDAEAIFKTEKWKEAQQAYAEFRAKHGGTPTGKQQAGTLKERLAAIDAAINPYKPGLVAVVFKDQRMDEKAIVLTRIDPNVDWDIGKRTVSDGGPRDNFCSRWQGSIKIEKEGKYRFDLDADDGGRVFINGKLVLDRWDRNASKNLKRPDGDIHLAPGMHELKVEHIEHGGGAKCKLLWSLEKGFNRVLVPPEVLMHSPRLAPKDE